MLDHPILETSLHSSKYLELMTLHVDLGQSDATALPLLSPIVVEDIGDDLDLRAPGEGNEGMVAWIARAQIELGVARPVRQSDSADLGPGDPIELQIGSEGRRKNGFRLEGMNLSLLTDGESHEAGHISHIGSDIDSDIAGSENLPDHLALLGLVLAVEVEGLDDRGAVTAGYSEREPMPGSQDRGPKPGDEDGDDPPQTSIAGRVPGRSQPERETAQAAQESQDQPSDPFLAASELPKKRLAARVAPIGWATNPFPAIPAGREEITSQVVFSRSAERLALPDLLQTLLTHIAHDHPGIEVHTAGNDIAMGGDDHIAPEIGTGVAKGGATMLGLVAMLGVR